MSTETERERIVKSIAGMSRNDKLRLIEDQIMAVGKLDFIEAEESILVPMITALERHYDGYGLASVQLAYFQLKDALLVADKKVEGYPHV